MIAYALKEDVPQIVDLLNSAYRGERSQQGWTTEAHLIAGDVRTDEADVLRVLEQSGSIILKYTDAENNIVGTVNLQQHERGVYLGMFAVSPVLQGGVRAAPKAQKSYPPEVKRAAQDMVRRGMVKNEAEYFAAYDKENG